MGFENYGILRQPTVLAVWRNTAKLTISINKILKLSCIVDTCMIMHLQRENNVIDSIHNYL